MFFSSHILAQEQFQSRWRVGVFPDKEKKGERDKEIEDLCKRVAKMMKQGIYAVYRGSVNRAEEQKKGESSTEGEELLALGKVSWNDRR